MAGDAALASVGGYQLEGIGVHLFERDRGRLFHHSRPAAVAAARRFCGSNGCSLSNRSDEAETRDVHSRPDRLDRHGKIHHGEAVRRGGRAGATMPTPPCTGSMRARRRRRSRRLSRARPCNGKVDRDKLGKRVLGDAAGDQAARSTSCIRWWAPGGRAVSGRGRAQAARRSWCSTFRCCSRPAARSAATRWWWSRRRPRCSAQRAFERPGMTEEQARRHPGEADAGRRKAPARRFRGGYVARIRPRARPGA